MKTIVKRLARDEKGAALVLVLILLLISGLIIGPLLSYMGTGLITGEVYETRTDELYAADAGVEDAIWKIQHGETPVCPGSPEKWSYNIADINGKNVTVYIEYDVDAGMYKITSISAIDDGGGTAAITGTAIEAYLSVSYLDFSALLDNALVSQDTITISPNSEVHGDVWLPDEEDLDNKGDIYDGVVKDSDDMIITWPTYEQLSTYYMGLVQGAPDPGDSIDIKDTKTIGPCLTEGSLVVDNTGDPDTLVLEGTVYVNGDLEFQQAGSNNYTVDLNGNTIFAEGSIDFPSEHVSISGSGCIIAVGDIDFHPSITSGGDDFVLIMSIAGEVQFHPNGIFTGCIAGDANVDLQPNSYIQWISPEGKGLDVPWGAGGADETPIVTWLSIESWEVIRLSPEDLGG